VNKTNFTSTCGQWRYFGGFCGQISLFCMVLHGNFVFACVVSSVRNGEKLIHGFGIQRDELLDSSYPF